MRSKELCNPLSSIEFQIFNFKTDLIYPSPYIFMQITWNSLQRSILFLFIKDPSFFASRWNSNGQSIKHYFLHFWLRQLPHHQQQQSSLSLLDFICYCYTQNFLACWNSPFKKKDLNRFDLNQTHTAYICYVISGARTNVQWI